MPLRRLLRMVLRPAGVAYPLLILALCRNGIGTEGPRGLALLFFAAAVPAIVASLWIARQAQAAPGPRRWLVFAACIGALAAALGWFAPQLQSHYRWFFLCQDLGFFLALAWCFGSSLAPGREPLCTYFAAMVHPQMSSDVRRYTRAVTVAWTLFFVAIAAVSALLFVATNSAVWALFANLLTPGLIIVFFVAENACRHWCLPAADRVGLRKTFAAIRMGGFRGFPRNPAVGAKPAG